MQVWTGAIRWRRLLIPIDGSLTTRRNSGGFNARTLAAEDAVLTTPLLPGFSLSIPELFKLTL
jgi:hypothetical protein